MTASEKQHYDRAAKPPHHNPFINNQTDSKESLAVTLHQTHTQNATPAFGIVYKKSTGGYTVQSGSRMVACGLSTRLRKNMTGPNPAKSARRPSKHDEPSTDPIAVGDEVHWVETPEGTGTIVEVLPRRNKLARRSPVPMPSAMAFEQVIVANVDQVVPVFAAARPEPRWNMLDRYLVTAEAAGLPSVICITKLDLAQDEDGKVDEGIVEAMEEYRRIGYRVIAISSHTGQGLDELREALSGRVSVLLGKSGVGKTSLLNAIQPGLGLRVNEVSQANNKGKHTTTHLEMFPVALGQDLASGAIVDTPGVREFGLWGLNEDDLLMAFPEMRPFVGQCRFGLDCNHEDEPGCAVRKAVMSGHISPRRYQSYMRLKEDL
jgi:ribosome biogenesis GTPase / thiamine phosphate phosphatase